MPVKTYKPTSPGRRGMSVSTFEEITKPRPERALTEPMKKTAGRNNNGRITTRHRGGGHKRLYRVIDWKRNKIGVPGRVIAIEYDPNRSARIALVQYEDGERRYILAPVGSIIHNIELKPGRGGQLVRGAGVGAQLMAKEGAWAQVRLPSGEVRLVHTDCMATLGQVGNPEHATISIGKAGRTRHMG